MEKWIRENDKGLGTTTWLSYQTANREFVSSMSCKICVRGKGIRPIRASGTRFVSHKVAALGRVIDKFGAYLGHLISLTEDPTVKSVDKQKINGYVTKWQDSKSLFGCAFL